MRLTLVIVGWGLTAAAHAADASRGVYRADDAASPRPVSPAAPSPAPAADDTLDLWDLPPPPPVIRTTDDLLRTRASLEMVDIDLLKLQLEQGDAVITTPDLVVRNDLAAFEATSSGDFAPFEPCTLAEGQHPRGRLEIAARLEGGAFTSIDVTRDTTGEPRVAACLVDLLSAWQLPPELAQEVTWRLDLRR